LRILVDAVRSAPQLAFQPFRAVLLKQIYFTGIEALPLLAPLALVAGFASLSPLHAALLQDMNTTVMVFRILVLQEAVPLLVGFFILARSGSAIASELASNRQNNEVANIYRMGIDVGEYLIAPRVAALALSMAVLVAYFQIFTVFGGFALMSIYAGWDFSLMLGKFAGGINPAIAILTIIKAMIFGILIGVISCQQGLSARRGPLGIPVAARTAAVHGITAIAIAEALFVLLFPR